MSEIYTVTNTQGETLVFRTNIEETYHVTSPDHPALVIVAETIEEAFRNFHDHLKVSRAVLAAKTRMEGN